MNGCNEWIGCGRGLKAIRMAFDCRYGGGGPGWACLAPEKRLAEAHPQEYNLRENNLENNDRKVNER